MNTGWIAKNGKEILYLILWNRPSIVMKVPFFSSWSHEQERKVPLEMELLDYRNDRITGENLLRGRSEKLHV